MKTQATTPASSKYPQTTVTAIVDAPIGQAFNYIAPIYLRISSLAPGLFLALLTPVLMKDGTKQV